MTLQNLIDRLEVRARALEGASSQKFHGTMIQDARLMREAAAELKGRLRFANYAVVPPASTSDVSQEENSGE